MELVRADDAGGDARRLDGLWRKGKQDNLVPPRRERPGVVPAEVVLTVRQNADSHSAFALTVPPG
jgi:hypothetical protein